jgi:hypothetical protein
MPGYRKSMRGTPVTRESDAAKVVAKAAEVAAETAERVAEAAAARIAGAVKAAADSVAMAANVQASAAQTTAAVVTARLDAMEKRYDKHEDSDRDRFEAIHSGQVEMKTDLRIEIKDVAEDVKDLALDQKKQTKTITLMTGGLVAISTILNLGVGLLVFFHNK